MKKITIIFGGKSVEHDISIITGLQIINIAKKNYEIFPIYVDGEGRWWTAKNLDDVKIYSDFSKKAIKKRKVHLSLGEGCFMVNKKKVQVLSSIICLHGVNGEDGQISALLEAAKIPYSCSGVLSSSVTMDKSLTKIVLDYNNIKNTKFVTINKGEMINLEGFEFPVIIKPANLGSSVGISVAKNIDELKVGLEVAFKFDHKVLIEQYLKDCEEFNCACLEYNGKYFVSNVLAVSKGEIFSFDEKYIKNGSYNEIKISSDLKKDIEDLTKLTYKTLQCFGVVRVDFLYKDEILYVNEVNNIPGALACYLFNERFDEILDLIIDESIRREEKKKEIEYSFKSDALKIFENENFQMLKK